MAGSSETADRVLEVLDSHADLRRRGVPVATTLVGTAGASLCVARTWAASRGLVHISLWATPEEVPAQAADALCDALHLDERARARAADLLACSEQTLVRWLTGEGSLERRRTLEALAQASDDGVLCARLLGDDPRRRHLRAWVAETEPAARVASLLRLAASTEVALIWTTALVLGREELPALRFFTDLAERVPGLHLLIPLGEAQFDALEAVGAPHARAVLEAGEARTGAWATGSAAAGKAQLARYGASAMAEESFQRALGAQPPEATSSVELERARSAAEAFLFTMLEEVPSTAGLFRLNQRWASAGPTLELDLFAPSVGLAIEVDGYFHFRDPDAYRRDRRRDRLLQRAGLVVLRFLAEDVLVRLEEILATVVDFVAWRRATK